jgi:uncharacterized damage-inducible protein DinB
LIYYLIITKKQTIMEKDVLEKKISSETVVAVSAEALLGQWLGHRSLTRKMILAFPEDKLFTYSVGGLRPFSELIMEMVRMGAPGIDGVVNRKWQNWEELQKVYGNPRTREELMKLWDAESEKIKTLWPKISQERFQEMDSFFGMYDGPIYWSILYLIDNEIHHRGQGYVYLRSLGIAPPPFWERE